MENEIIKADMTQDLTAQYSSMKLPTLYSVKSIQTNLPIRKISDVWSLPSDVHTIGRFVRDFGAEKTIAYLKIWILDYIEFVNVKRAMTNQQITNTAELIMEEFSSLKIPEINYVFKEAKKGHYGTLYSEIDGVIILSYFQKYFDERLNEAERIAIEEHKQSKIDRNNLVLSPELVKEAYKLHASGEFNKHEKEKKQESVDEAYKRWKDEYHKKGLESTK